MMDIELFWIFWIEGIKWWLVGVPVFLFDVFYMFYGNLESWNF